MHKYQLLKKKCLFFSHSIKMRGNEPKFIFFYDLFTSLSTDIVDIIIKILNTFKSQVK